MQTVLIVFHIIISIILVSVILLQRTSSDELQGIGGGGSSSMDGIMSSASSANFMTRLTSILAAIFIINCLVLSNLSSRGSSSSIADKVQATQNTNTVAEKSLPMAE